MKPKEAYDAIRKALARSPTTSIVDTSYNDAAFGNFVIAFEVQGQPRSLVNDRGELVLCADLTGTRQCATVASSISDMDEESIIRALDL